MRASEPVIALAGLVAFEGVKTVRDFMPDHRKLRRSSPEDAGAMADVRTAEVMAGGTLVITGAVLSYITSSWVPVSVAAISAGAMAGFYEWELRRTDPVATDEAVSEPAPGPVLTAMAVP